ncbi:hypothetical protein AARAC_001926 [Aspergillus arachidicola]|uniref:Transcription factor domain-containing protein n=1 Tax=Aspergillus arachidicola TaxID=656916 RepID=A0A2G7GBC1_9EURO|nr:hypothetical protein AARAC_001926 [Aspergillus arachidicola]
MDITVGPEELVVPFGLDLVLHAREESRVAIISGLNARAKTSNAQRLTTQQRENDAETERLKTIAPSLAEIPGLEDFLEASSDGGIPPERALVIADQEFTALGERYSDETVPDLDFSDFLNAHIDDDNIHYTTSGSSSVYHSTSSTHATIQLQHPRSFPTLSIPPVPTQAIRSLVQRPNTGIGTHRIAKLILHNLISYPQMILRHNTLPPFIHPSVVSSNLGNPNLEPLTNCIALVHMIGSGIQASRKLFWRNVRMECERLCEECQTLNKWELLAAMQALSIYIIIRLDEGETDYNNFDVLLLKAITAISKQLSCSDFIRNVDFVLHSHDLESSWKDWIFEESRRRLCVIYRVVNMLVYFEPAAMCGLRTDIVIAPLPSRKQLWEAGDKVLWRAEMKREPGIQTAFGLAANGDLVQLGEDQLYSADEVLLHKTFTSRGSATWEEWCSGMDGLGGLVMLAASLIG